MAGATLEQTFCMSMYYIILGICYWQRFGASVPGLPGGRWRLIWWRNQPNGSPGFLPISSAIGHQTKLETSSGQFDQKIKLHFRMHSHKLNKQQIHIHICCNLFQIDLHIYNIIFSFHICQNVMTGKCKSILWWVLFEIIICTYKVLQIASIYIYIASNNQQKWTLNFAKFATEGRGADFNVTTTTF